MFSNRHQSIPPLFVEIMENHDKQAAIFGLGSAMSIQDWRKIRSLRASMRDSLIPGAEKLLRHNTDKGNE